jgi:hypothetical protein
MKYEKTAEDEKIVEYDLQHDRTLKYLKNLSFYKFSVGDVLIREEKCYNYADNTYSWKIKLAGCDLPYKYIYAFENELGVGYIRRLSVNGRKFVEKATCVTTFDPDQTRFILDPEYADHMLLSSENDEFDAKSRYDEIKKKREAIHRKNKKIRLQFKDEQAAADWIKTLKKGDQIWWGYTISSIHKEPYLVDEIYVDASRGVGNMAVRLTTVPGPKSYNYGSTLYASSLMHYNVFTQRPTFMEDVVD